MNQPNYQQALEAFKNPLHDVDIEALDGGLINSSYKVTNEDHHYSFLLQRINHHVFTRPQDVQDNYLVLWNYIRDEELVLKIPEPKFFLENASLYYDSNHNYWRVFEFIENSMMLRNAETSEQARTTAETFANFTAAFKGLDVELLKETIPGFHDLSNRYKQFLEALSSERFERIYKASVLIEELKNRVRYVNFYELITESNEFPRRVMHHDAKIANILFSKTTGKVICPVDFDTTMPGYFFSDIGDMIRSMACSLDESSIDFENITIRKDYYKKIVDGYMSVMEKQFTSSEKKYIHYAGLIMINMQALRYLTDYLNGDIYYKTNYAEQNLDRTKNQLILLSKLEEFLQHEYHFGI